MKKPVPPESDYYCECGRDYRHNHADLLYLCIGALVIYVVFMTLALIYGVKEQMDQPNTTEES